MAYIDEIEDEEEGQGQGSGEVITSGGSGSTVPSGGNQGSSQEGEKTASSTGWTNLQNYITANKGNAGQMGQKVAGDIGQFAQETIGGKQALQGEVSADVAKNTVQDSGVIGALSSDPTKVDKTAYERQRDATYGGPTDLASYNRYADVQKKVQGLGQKLAATESEEGRRALLSESYARPDYGYGMQSLDSFILGAAPESVQQIQNTRQQYGNVGSDWEALQGQLGESIRQGVDTTAKTAADTRAAYEQVYGKASGRVSEAETEAARVNAARDAKIADLTAKVSSSDPNVRAQGYQEAGIDAGVAEYLLANGVSPAQVIKDMGDVGIGNYLSAADRARFEALSALENRGITRDLARTGATTDFSLDTDFLTKGARAREIQTAAEKLAEQRNAEREAEFKRLQRMGLGDGEIIGILGVTPKEAQALKGFGGSYGAPITRGARVDTGDVLTDAQRQEWADLMNALGLQSDFKYQDTQDEGAAYRVDDAMKNDLVSRAVADRQRQLEWEVRQRQDAGRIQNFREAMGDQVADELNGLSDAQAATLIDQAENSYWALPQEQRQGGKLEAQMFMINKIRELRGLPPNPSTGGQEPLKLDLSGIFSNIRPGPISFNI